MNQPAKPRLIIADERQQQPGLASSTFEQRQGYRDRNGARLEGQPGIGMTAAELIKLMGPLHVDHPEYKARDSSVNLNPEPNLADVQPTISRTDYGIFSDWKRFLRWALR